MIFKNTSKIVSMGNMQTFKQRNKYSLKVFLLVH